MTSPFAQPDDATPLDAGEREGLRQSWIITRADLNEAEQLNIDSAMGWTRRRRKTELLAEAFVFELHRRMFGKVWRWAGTQRTTAKNIGVDAAQIPVRLGALLDDTRYWVRHDTYPADEIAIRLHHGLVAIHPLPNGNGRHARLMADLLVSERGARPFSWGGGTLQDVGELRAAYMSALRAADAHDIAPLLAFARA